MKKNLTRAELAQAVFDDLGLSFSESERLVDSFFGSRKQCQNIIFRNFFVKR